MVGHFLIKKGILYRKPELPKSPSNALFGGGIAKWPPVYSGRVIVLIIAKVALISQHFVPALVRGNSLSTLSHLLFGY